MERYTRLIQVVDAYVLEKSKESLDNRNGNRMISGLQDPRLLGENLTLRVSIAFHSGGGGYARQRFRYVGVYFIIVLSPGELRDWG